MIEKTQELDEKTRPSKPSILGTCNVGIQQSDPQSHEERLRTYRVQRDAWLEAEVAEISPRGPLSYPRRRLEIRSIALRFSCKAAPALTVINYIPPKSNALQFLSLEPLALLQPAQGPQPMSEAKITRPRYAHLSANQYLQQTRAEKLVALDPVRMKDAMDLHPKGRAPGSGLRKAVELINRASTCMSNLDTPSRETRHSQECSASAHTNLSIVLYPLSRTCSIFQTILRTSLGATRDAGLVGVSMAACQLDLRLGQLSTWPSLGNRLRRWRRSGLVPTSDLSARYISLWNGVWLVANDLIIGHAVGAFVCDHHQAIAAAVSQAIQKVALSSIQELLVWLGNWPAGIKLNAELASFFGDMFRGLIDLWEHTAYKTLHAQLPQAIVLIGMSGRYFGLTMLLSLTSDLISISTLHLSIFYILARYINSFFLYLLGVLFHLFRGKKRNPLRGGRVDDATYDVDQLMLGTILFTLLAFLYPTVFLYYVAFASIRYCIVVATTALDTLRAIFNHLPLFAILLRIKDPSRLPAGISMQRIDDSHDSQFSSAASHFELRSVPLDITSLFVGYRSHFAGLIALPSLLAAIFTGQYISAPDGTGAHP
ncbi:Gpi1-domain-containing protein [Ceraceosorus guamensis]|uniref:Gpi1-domain-containing protein n=1 Tax=Ceraceosorus guamensis TaxID=1522189 RepID=A0A316W0J0_9BASI|nr:Gpi1-domain-containing protein [Ceraceosorus guamensis]PWN42233.1 Gpi1-domain-containing protein [Ceraceosorus guamensis]